MLAGLCRGISCQGDPDGKLCLAELPPDTLSPAAAAVGRALSVELGQSKGSAVHLWPLAAGVTLTPTFVSCHPGASPHSSIMGPQGQRLLRAGGHSKMGKRSVQDREPRASAQPLLPLVWAAWDLLLPCVVLGSCQAGIPSLCGATFVFQFLQCLETEEMVDTILQLMSSHLQCDCKEIRRLVLRGLLVLCKSPWKVRRAG